MPAIGEELVALVSGSAALRKLSLCSAVSGALDAGQKSRLLMVAQGKGVELVWLA